MYWKWKINTVYRFCCSSFFFSHTAILKGGNFYFCKTNQYLLFDSIVDSHQLVLSSFIFFFALLLSCEKMITSMSRCRNLGLDQFTHHTTKKKERHWSWGLSFSRLALDSDLLVFFLNFVDLRRNRLMTGPEHREKKKIRGVCCVIFYLLSQLSSTKEQKTSTSIASLNLNNHQLVIKFVI